MGSDRERGTGHYYHTTGGGGDGEGGGGDGKGGDGEGGDGEGGGGDGEGAGEGEGGGGEGRGTTQTGVWPALEPPSMLSFHWKFEPSCTWQPGGPPQNSRAPRPPMPKVPVPESEAAMQAA